MRRGRGLRISWTGSSRDRGEGDCGQVCYRPNAVTRVAAGRSLPTIGLGSRFHCSARLQALYCTSVGRAKGWHMPAFFGFIE